VTRADGNFMRIIADARQDNISSTRRDVKSSTAAADEAAAADV